MTLLQDSKFSADRTDMRLWHELRYVRSLWSREEEDQLRQDCAAVTDGDDIQSTSNAVLWTACFDRYGVPLSDIFTYGLRPHPSHLRRARKKLLSPQFCDLLTSVMVHPIFKGDPALLRYILQVVVRIRVGMHVPPMGTMPDMDDTSLDRVKLLADTLLLEEDTPEERLLVHADAYLIISQKQGARFHPEIVMLEDLLSVHFSNEGYVHTAPLDNVPYSRFLFYLQSWDLQFLLNVLDGLSFGTSYLSVDRYKTMWINDTPKIQGYISNKLDSLVQQWFLIDERNHRIRHNLKHEDPEKRLYDIPEEDFNPTYARSQYVTHTMRAVLEGEYLEALYPRHPPSDPIAESPTAESPVDETCAAESPIAVNFVGREEAGSNTDTMQLPANRSSPRDLPVSSIEESGTNTVARVTASDEDQQASPEPEVKLEAESDPDDSGGENDGAHGGNAEDSDSEGDEGQARSCSETSLISIQSITSSKAAADDQQDNFCDSPGQGKFPRRGLPLSDQ